MSQRFQAEHWIARPLPEIFAFFADPHNLPRLMPPRQGAKLIRLNLVPPRLPADSPPLGSAPMAGLGTEIVFKFRAIPYVPIHEKWTAVITGFSLNQSFSDVQKQGPFRRWEHTHRFEQRTVQGCPGTLIRDDVEYDVGFGIVGSMLERLIFRRAIRNMFEFRKHALQQIFPGEGSPQGV